MEEDTFEISVKLTFRYTSGDPRSAEYNLLARLREDAKKHSTFANDDDGTEIQLINVEDLP